MNVYLQSYPHVNRLDLHIAPAILDILVKGNKNKGMKKELKESLMEAADKNCDVCGGRGVFNRQDGPEDFEAVPCVCVLCKNCGNYPCGCDAQVDAYREQNGAV